ncbi:hypothetical protein BD414DRAFT_419244 [Trametes punicea]|nr:hypothetical protein BD414DRAFT_419244 [Trametes punicea]
MALDKTAHADSLPGLRRVVTGHRAADGVAIVKSDDVIPSREDGHPDLRVGPLWATGSLPVDDNNDETDGTARRPDGDFGIVMKSGTNLQFTDLAPGATAAMHRTSSVDHNILIRGKLILVMEDGSETLLDQPGDVVVQRGTIHAWRNPGPEWARWITVVIDAKPAVVNGKVLEATSLL